MAFGNLPERCAVRHLRGIQFDSGAGRVRIGRRHRREQCFRVSVLRIRENLRRAAHLYQFLADHYAREAMPALARKYGEKWFATQTKLRYSDQVQQDFEGLTVRVLGLEKRWQEALVITERNLKQKQLLPKQIHQWEDLFFTTCIGAQQVPKAITLLEDQLSKPGTELQSKQILLRDIAHLQLIDGNYLAAEKILKDDASPHNGGSWRVLLGLCRSSLLQHRYTEAANCLKQAEEVRVKSWGVHASPSYNILLLKIATSAASGSDSQAQSLIKTNLQVKDSISDPRAYINDLDQRLCEQEIGEFLSPETLTLFTANIKKARYATDKYGRRSSIR